MKRSDFPTKARRIVVKVGTTVVTQPDGSFALGRLGDVVEQISQLQKMGKQVVLVSSGAVGKGAQELSRQALLTLPLSGFLQNGSTFNQKDTLLMPRACAAAGQSGMMSLYDDMFSQKGVAISQILLTENDFKNIEIRKHVQETLEILLKWNVVPIINENDVISTRSTPIRDESGAIFWDNDSLAALIATEVKADLLILLSDVEGIFTRHPNDPKAVIISTYKSGMDIIFGEKSRVGRGGMQAKIDAAISAIEIFSIPAVVIASGYKKHTIVKIMKGKRVGTLFTKSTDDRDDPKKLAIEARTGSLLLRASPSQQRRQILLEYANLLEQNTSKIIAANNMDIKTATFHGVDQNLINRLKLNDVKLTSVIKGIRQIADKPDPIGLVLSRTELAKDLMLEKQSTPIGVLLVIFESRPDVLPQLVSLSIKTGNGLLLKGGKEAQKSNAILFNFAQEAISKVTNNQVSRSIGLVQTRDDIDDLLKLHNEIDLIIPRGSSALVRHIKAHTKIPVLGHAEGICHIYIHEDVDLEKAIRISLDAKLDYPAACNSVETILIHKNFLNDKGYKFLSALRSANIELYGCPKAIAFSQLYPDLRINQLKNSFHHEYGAAEATIAIVENHHEAIDHINAHGSNHTESILTDNKEIAAIFLQRVDSACVFHNASTRFADGYRFGLGAEVGISNGRIHARGPVGGEGLLTSRWVLVSSDPNGHIVSEFSNGQKHFTHISKL
jgi:delta-1-pyrroline-5-carboxylate synthetase